MTGYYTYALRRYVLESKHYAEKSALYYQLLPATWPLDSAQGVRHMLLYHRTCSYLTKKEGPKEYLGLSKADLIC